MVQLGQLSLAVLTDSGSGISHTNKAGGSAWVGNYGSGINGTHYTSQSVGIPIGSTTTTTTSTQTDTASNQS